MGEAAAVWRLGPGSKKAEKRNRKDDKLEEKLPTGRKAKRLKREKVTNWGEVEVEDEMDVRSWLVKGNQEEESISKKKEDDMVSTPMMLPKRMKQLELSWRMHMHPGVVEPAKVENVSTPKVKLTKKEALKKAVETSKSILDWIKPTQKK